MSSEFYTVCNDKNILLEKNDDDNYRINMSIIPSPDATYNIIDIIYEYELWNLIYELNNDNIESFNLNTDKTNNCEEVFIKVRGTSEKQISEELKNIIIHFKCNYLFISNVGKECFISSVNLEKSTVKFNNFKIHILIDNDNVTKINIEFMLVDYNDLINTYIALYIKKIFYRLTKYLS